jgi:tRNA pseudouridine38-40 synthase
MAIMRRWHVSNSYNHLRFRVKGAPRGVFLHFCGPFFATRSPWYSQYPGGVVRLRLLVAYHGAAFSGLAPQPGKRTVTSVVAEALGRITRMEHPPVLAMSGRTDAGVHSWGQVLHADVPDVPGGINTARLQKSLRTMLSPEIVVREVSIVDASFDARYSAIWRRYRYTILNDRNPDPWLADTAWFVQSKLNLDVMRLGLDPLIGEHDFSSFCTAPEKENRTNRRRVISATLHRPAYDPRLMVFEIVGNAFCRQMVRSITGFLVEIGKGKRTPGEVRSVLLAQDRHLAAKVAPAHGLCLWEVGYPGDPVDGRRQ